MPTDNFILHNKRGKQKIAQAIKMQLRFASEQGPKFTKMDRDNFQKLKPMRKTVNIDIKNKTTKVLL